MSEAKEIKFRDEAIVVDFESMNLSYSFGEARPRAVSAPALGAAPVPTDPSQEEIAQIRELIQKFESLLPEEVQESMGVLTTSPYYSVSNGNIDIIGEEELANWLNSDEFKRIVEGYEGSEPHTIEIVEFSAVLIDPQTASAQYSIKDTTASGNVNYAKSAVLAVKQDQSTWKVSVHCQHPVP